MEGGGVACLTGGGGRRRCCRSTCQSALVTAIGWHYKPGNRTDGADVAGLGCGLKPEGWGAGDDARETIFGRTYMGHPPPHRCPKAPPPSTGHRGQGSYIIIILSCGTPPRLVFQAYSEQSRKLFCYRRKTLVAHAT